MRHWLTGKGLNISLCSCMYCSSIALSFSLPQTIHISTQPAVQSVLIAYNESQTDTLSMDTVCLNIGDEMFSFMTEASEEDIASAVNELVTVQSIGFIEVFREDNELYSEHIYLTFVFVTNLDVNELAIPLLSVSPDAPDCNPSHLNISIQTIQNFTIAQSINLGFNDTTLPRYTNNLPLDDLTTNSIRDEVTKLFGYVCDEPSESSDGSIRFRASYEDSTEDSRDNSTSYCGLFSLRSPTTLWEENKASGEESIDITKHRQV